MEGVTGRSNGGDVTPLGGGVSGVWGGAEPMRARGANGIGMHA